MGNSIIRSHANKITHRSHFFVVAGIRHTLTHRCFRSDPKTKKAQANFLSAKDSTPELSNLNFEAEFSAGGGAVRGCQEDWICR